MERSAGRDQPTLGLGSWLTASSRSNSSTSSSSSSSSRKRPPSGTSSASTSSAAQSSLLRGVASSSWASSSSRPPSAPQQQPQQLWVDKYRPRRREELCIHKPLVAKVHAWLDGSRKSLAQRDAFAPKLLLLTGPPGGGKTALVRVLALERGLELREWNAPAATGTRSWGDAVGMEWREARQLERHELSLPYLNHLQSFEHFLLGSTRYAALPMASSGGAPVGGNGTLVLVDELPHLSHADQRESFAETVRAFMAASKHPVVFVVSTEATSGGRSGRATSKRDYFPAELLAHPCLCEMEVKEVNKTNLQRALSRICERELSGGGPSKAQLEQIAASCHGDVRTAINNLQFSCLGLPLQGSATSRRQAKRKSCAKGPPSKRGKGKGKAAAAEMFGRDTQLNMFRSLGRVLYTKREGEGQGGAAASASSAAEERLLPQYRRAALVHRPEAIIEDSATDSSVFLDQLSQNYVEFFTLIEDASVAADGLSDGQLMSRWHEDGHARAHSQRMGASVAVRALCYANTKPAQRKFRQFNYESDWRAMMGRQEYQKDTDARCVAAGEQAAVVQSSSTRNELASYSDFILKNRRSAAPGSDQPAAARELPEGEEEDPIEEIEEIDDDE